MTGYSVNQIAQINNDTSRNESQRIKIRETKIKSTWLDIAYRGDGTVSVEEIKSAHPEYCENYIRNVLGVVGYVLRN